MPYFDDNTPYYDAIQKGQFPWAVSTGLSQLEKIKETDPTKYAAPKGTPFYFMGIAAFASHDYQTATFFFDAAVSEDVKHYAGDRNKPAMLFMRLDKTGQGEAAQQIVDIVVDKLKAALKDYTDRKGSKPLTLDDVREHFLNHQERPHLRTLTTTFVSFLAEWDYRSAMIDLPDAEVSREPFFTHLFRGCLLFESLLKDKMPPPVEPPWLTRLWTKFFRRKGRVASYTTLGPLLKINRQALGIGRVKASSSTFEEILPELKSNEPLRAAIQCAARVRNTLGHDLAWAAQSLDRERYDLLTSNIAASCLHAIACLYVPR
jgi:hypothetical protein